MKFHFKNHPELTLIDAEEYPHCNAALAKAIFDYKSTEHHIQVTAEDMTSFPQYPAITDAAKIAFLIAAKALKQTMQIDCDPQQFSLPRGGHMVKYGTCYTSYGTNPEESKRRVSDGFTDVANVGFYVRHSLLVMEHRSHDRITAPSRTPCL